ncbi:MULTISPECIES: response regulator [Bacillus]|uniref:response regulator n=1 Tax=Bacillus TaxID=1386 RepID=UPI000BB6F48D|nr:MULTISPECIES: response regulator transcription factor [Bacillus]
MMRIVIAEDQKMLLGAIGALLNLEDDMEVVGQASNGEEAIDLVHQLDPDICIMDVEMPIKSGLDAAEELKAHRCHVVILTTFARDGYFRRALELNVKGYLLKDTPSDELANSIRSIANGKRLYSPELLDDCIYVTGDHALENGTHQNKTVQTVKSYFSTMMEKIKTPTG